MIQKALQYLVGLGATEIKRDADGVKWAHVPGRVDRVLDPLPEKLEFHTLEGLAQYITTDPDGISTDRFLHVESPTLVSLLEAIEDTDPRRVTLATAEFTPPAQRFGQYLTVEDFLIWLATGFVDACDRASVVKLVGNLRSEKVQTLADDGFTQVAAARAGVSKVAEVEIKNPVMLQPYRTFSESVQPASPYVLRLKEKDGAMLVALFEVGDTSWRVAAASNIRETLRSLICGQRITILV